MITINEFKNKLSSGSRLLGIDLGTKRIGIAISDYNQKIATPLQTLDKSKQGKLIGDKGTGGDRESLNLNNKDITLIKKISKVNLFQN